MRDPLDAAWSTALASCAEQGKPGWTQNHLQTVLHTWGHCSSDPWAEEGGDKITAIPQTTSEFSYSVPPPADHLLSSGNTTNGEGLQVSKEENSKWQSQSWAHYSLINLAKPFPFWNRIPGMDVINKETDKNYLWMNLSISRPRHSQEMPSTSNQPFILNSHHFLLLFPVQNYHSFRNCCRGRCVWMQGGLGQPSSDFAETPNNYLILRWLSGNT